MKKSFLMLAVLTAMLATGCRKIEVDGDGNGGNNGGNSNEVIIEGTISESKTLDDPSKKYILRNVVYVTNGATFTVKPGITVYGELATKGALVITRGAKINAEGTVDKPIVFTSQAADAAKRAGDWGGIVVLGNASTNATYNTRPGIGEIEGNVNNGFGYGLYGGEAFLMIMTIQGSSNM